MLKFNSVSFAYDPESDPVLDGIDLQIGRGECVAIMGSNGSGKTTLALLAARLLSPTSGSIEHDNTGESAGVVFQNPDNQIVSISVEHELAFPLGCRQVPPDEMRTRVDESVVRFGFDSMRDTSPSDLSGGEKQKLALASAMIARPGLLILDEPTSHLDQNSRDLLHDAIDDIGKNDPNLTILMITQSPSEALRFQRLIVMRDGRIAADSLPEDVFGDSELCRSCDIRVPDELLIESADDSQLPIVVDSNLVMDNDSERTSELVLIRELSFVWQDGVRVFDRLDLSVGEGRIVGLAAASGGGKTTLGYLLAGLLESSSGSIAWHSEKQNSSDLLTKVSYLFQFPERQMFADTVFDEIAFGLRQLGLPKDMIDSRVRSSLETLGLPHESFADRSPHFLSGGEMRKVALASIIALDRTLVFYDEPTAELDTESTDLLKTTFRALKSTGKTQIIASHDTDFLFETSDDIIVLRDGQVGFFGSTFELLDDPTILVDCGLSVPGVVDLCRSDGVREFVRTNRITSVRELVAKMK
jgi:energy-coupling factor transport system ATP-binding protein